MAAPKAKLNPTPPGRVILGLCKGGKEAERGLVSSETAPTPADWHARCPGVDSARRICECECHEPDGRCRACKTDDLPDGSVLCWDEVGCKRRQHEQLQNHPKYQQLQKCREQAKIAQGEVREIRRERAEPRPTTGRCEHCGEPTKGGRFVPGHDAKLKGILLGLATAENTPLDQAEDAVVELMMRDWVSANAKKKIPAMLIDQAEKLHNNRGVTWLAKRVADRIGERNQ